MSFETAPCLMKAGGDFLNDIELLRNLIVSELAYKVLYPDSLINSDSKQVSKILT